MYFIICVVDSTVQYSLVEVSEIPAHNMEVNPSLRVEAFGNSWDFDLSPINLVSPRYTLEMIDSEGKLHPMESQASRDHYYIGKSDNKGSINLRISDEGAIVSIIMLGNCLLYIVYFLQFQHIVLA